MSGNAFNSIAGILIFVSSLVAVAVPLTTSQAMLHLDKSIATVAPLGASALCLVCALIFFGQASKSMGPISVGPTLWFYLAVLIIVFMSFQAFQYWKGNQVSRTA